MHALILTLMTFGKVLSPQYFVWTLPVWALVAARDRVIAMLGGLTLLLTGIGFPAMYWKMLSMQHPALAVLIARNPMLVATFCFACWRLCGFGEEPTPTDIGGRPVAARNGSFEKR